MEIPRGLLGSWLVPHSADRQSRFIIQLAFESGSYGVSGGRLIVFWKATDRAIRWNDRPSKSDWKRPSYECTTTELRVESETPIATAGGGRCRTSSKCVKSKTKPTLRCFASSSLDTSRRPRRGSRSPGVILPPSATSSTRSKIHIHDNQLSPFGTFADDATDPKFGGDNGKRSAHLSVAIGVFCQVSKAIPTTAQSFFFVCNNDIDISSCTNSVVEIKPNKEEERKKRRKNRRRTEKKKQVTFAVAQATDARRHSGLGLALAAVHRRAAASRSCNDRGDRLDVARVARAHLRLRQVGRDERRVVLALTPEPQVLHQDPPRHGRVVDVKARRGGGKGREG